MRRSISRLVLLVFFCSVLFSSPRICVANTSEPIYIRADGSVDPPTAPISSMDNVTYTLDGNINNSIVVERSNIIIDGNGRTLQGSGLGKAFDLSCVNNVTITSTDISARNSGRDAHPNYGIYLFSSSFNTISGNNITDNYYAGIYPNESSNNNIIGNNITKNYHGIWLYHSNNNSIVGNNITNSGFFLPFPPIQIRTSGIKLDFSSDNFLRNNIMVDSDFNFGVLGVTLSDFVNDVDVSNIVDGKPVIYWVNRREVEVPLNAGYVALVNCTNVRIENLTLAKNMQGILLAYTNYTTITRNYITNNWNGILIGYSSNCNYLSGNNITANGGVGIAFTSCSNNTVFGNSITNTSDFGVYLNESSSNILVGNNIRNNGDGVVLWSSSFNNSLSENNIDSNYEYGIWILSSSNNKFYHNNFVSNMQQAYSYDPSYPNVWDDDYPSGGNYWSDDTGVDVNGDGIGDTPYDIDENNTDRYPLMAPLNRFDAGTWNGEDYSIDIVSNSTISDFHFNPEDGAFLIFNVTGESGTKGFCRATIPKSLLSAENGWNITVGGLRITNYTLIPDSSQNYTYLYFTYNHSTKTVIIQGTDVIPEFPSNLVLHLLIVTTLIAAALCKNLFCWTRVENKRGCRNRSAQSSQSTDQL